MYLWCNGTSIWKRWEVSCMGFASCTCGKSSSYMVHHLTSPIIFMPVWTGISWSLDRKRGAHFLPPYSPDLTSGDVSSRGFVKRCCLSWKRKCKWDVKQNYQTYRVHYQWNTCQYLVETEYHLAVCCATYGPPIRSTVQTRNCVSSNIWKCYQFLQYTLGLRTWNVLLYCHSRLNTYTSQNLKCHYSDIHFIITELSSHTSATAN